MCIGLPMQVTATRDGFATVAGRGQVREVNTALVGACAPGDWLLVFLDGAQERLDARRAAEIDATLDLLDRAGVDAAVADADAAFPLPSAMSAAQLAALTGDPST
jgi:hydrogenase expression/formation protein HypC